MSEFAPDPTQIGHFLAAKVQCLIAGRLAGMSKFGPSYVPDGNKSITKYSQAVSAAALFAIFQGYLSVGFARLQRRIRLRTA